MPNKVTIELRPYSALGILSFLKEFINESNRNDPRLTAIHETVDEYEKEVMRKISPDQLEDALLENKVNYLNNRHPPKEG